MPDNYLNSSIHTGEADVYVLSFSVEYACRLYRFRSTGIIFPLYSDFLVSHHFNESSYQQIAEKLGREPDFTPDEWRFMQDEFEFLCERDPEIFVADVCKIFEKLKGKLVVVLVLNERVGQSESIKGVYAEINRLVVPLVKTYGCYLVDYADLVHTENDLVTPDDHGVHYSREVYLKMAHKILDICTKYKDGTL